jgi:hypothetical protein
MPTVLEGQRWEELTTNILLSCTACELTLWTEVENRVPATQLHRQRVQGPMFGIRAHFFLAAARRYHIGRCDPHYPVLFNLAARVLR